MPAIKQPKVTVPVPQNPQSAADLARKYVVDDATSSAAKKVRDAEDDALKAYIHANHLEGDEQAIPFESAGGGWICAYLHVTPRYGFDLRYAPNDLILWAAANGILSVTAGKLEAQAGTKEYGEMMKLRERTGGAESIEFVAVEEK